MKIKKITTIVFSPTKTTKTIAQRVAQGTGIKDIQLIDITLPQERKSFPTEFDDELLLVGAPVYYGRLPELIVPFLKSLKGKNTPAVPIAVYGNRDYDDALLELSDILQAGGFNTIAAGAFIGEHSYSISGREIAHGRPDADDLSKAKEFGALVVKKILDVKESEAISIPGKHPYLEPVHLKTIKQLRKETPMTFAPETEKALCTACGKCAEVCPTGAIEAAAPTEVDQFKCIICFACIKHCPTGAKAMNEVNFNNAVEQLKNSCQVRKEPTFIV